MYSYSDNEELFTGHCETVADALAEALDNYPDSETIYVGEAQQRTIGEYLTAYHVESLLESLAEQAGEECGEVAEDWLAMPSIRKKADETKETYHLRIDAWKLANKERLEFLLDGFRIVLETWATEMNEQPRFWHVGKVQTFSREEAERLSA